MIKYVTLALALAFAVPSCAEEVAWDWELRSGSPTAKRHKEIKIAQRRRPKVMAYVDGEKERAPKKGDDGWHCLDKVRGLGTQWIGTEGAMDTAKKDWMERVRYDHGESYIDMTNAKDFESRCGRTSIGEVAGQVTYRCEILARPCKAPMQDVKKTK
jgi:hypothetical protein